MVNNQTCSLVNS